ncbi:MAG: SURF1 family protein [Sphingomonadaceae bacterium]|nr:SURF1 family protein [Sphingomonadaceae bacterium]
MRKLPIIPTFIVVAAMAVMVALGFWQLDRKDQKEAMIARFEAAAGNPQPLSAFPAENPLDSLYRRASFVCETVTSWSAIAGRNASDAAGYAHVAHCSGGGGTAEIVLGWSREPGNPAWSGGTVQGMIAPGSEAGWRLVADPPQAGLEANATPDPSDTPNNHLAYAGQWFFFALVAGVIYILAVRKRLRESGK